MKCRIGVRVFGTLFVSVLMMVLWQLPLTAEEFNLPELESGKVSLSWAELKTLLDELEALKREKLEEETQSDLKKALEAEPPVSHSISRAEFKGEIQAQTVRFEATFQFDLFKAGWITFPLFSQPIAVESVRIEPAVEDTGRFATLKEYLGQESQAAEMFPAQLINTPTGYDFFGRGPGSFTARIVFQAPIRTENFTQTFRLHVPQAVMSQLEMAFPEQGARLLESSSPGVMTQQEGQPATFRAALTEQDELTMVWKLEKEAGIRRKSLASVYSLASVEKTVMTVDSLLVIQRLSSLEELELFLPPEVEILEVSGDALTRWYIEPSAERQRLVLVGQQEQDETLEINIAYRIRLQNLPAQASVPIITVQGIDTLEGFLGIQVLDNLEITTGETQHGVLIPAKNLPQPLWRQADNALIYGYEYTVPDFQASLHIKSYQEIQTIVASVDVVDCVTHRTLEGKSITGIRYVIRNNDRQFLTLTLPPQSRIWQVFLDGSPVKPAQKDSGELLIPMKKSHAQGEEFQTFSIELGYISDVDKFSLKGDMLNELPAIDVPINYLRWTLYLPEDYEYTHFEGPLKQTAQLSGPEFLESIASPQIRIPTQGKRFFFEKHLIVDEVPYIRGKYGQHLGDDIFLSVQPGDMSVIQKVTPRSSY